MKRSGSADVLESLRRVSGRLASLSTSSDLRVLRAELDGATRTLERTLLDGDELSEWFRARGYPVASDGTVTSSAAAAALGITPKTLRNKRALGAGPRWLVIRRTPRYPIAAIAEYLRSPDPSRPVP